MLAGGRVAREGDARGGVRTGVAEDHRLHVDGGAEQLANVVQLAVLDCAGVVPRGEDRLDPAPELLHRILGEGLAGGLLDHLEVAGDHLVEVRRGQVGVELGALGLLDGVELVLEVVVLNAHDDVAVHLDEAAAGVLHEPLVAREVDQRLRRHVVQPEIEHGVHHAGHRGCGAGAHGDEQRVRALAEALARGGLQLRQGVLHFLADDVEELDAAEFVVLGAGLGGDGESRGDGQAQFGHVGEIGALAAEKLAHRGFALGLTCAEEVDKLGVLDI